MAFPGYLAFTDPITLTRILRANGGFDASRAGRVLALYALSLPFLPLAWCERLLYGARVERQPLHPSPLVILGHDRSGTTHLLNLLSLDGRFSYTRPSQMILPRCSLLLDRLVDSLLARVDYRRPFDDIRVGPGSPQDDEAPLVKLTPHCEYHKYSFPRSHRRWLDRYVKHFAPGAPGHAEWRRVYLGTLKTAAFLMRRDRPLLKSPATMGNLAVLLDLFPRAKFVHIKRNPFRVLPSQIHLHRTMITRYGLESVSDREIVDFAFYQYRLYMDSFLAQEHLVPPESCCEIRYEELDADPIGGLRAIYERLDLGDFGAVEERARAHLEATRADRRHDFRPDAALQDRIRRELAFAFERLGYDADSRG